MSLIYESLKERLAVHIYDQYFMALCPFHESRVGHADNRPSFMVSDNYDYFKCKSCGASGKLEYLQRYIDGQEYDPTMGRAPERVYPVLPKWRKWLDKYGSIENVSKAAHKLYQENPEFHSFFIRRDIDHYGEIGMFGWLDWWNLFPVKDQRGKVIDIVLRADKGKGDTKYVLLKKSEEHTDPPLYVPDWERFMMARTIYVPYGIIDAWALYDIGLPSATGTTGKSLNARLLRRYGKNWIIVPDHGEEEEAWKLKIELGSTAKVKELDYPIHTKDPDNIRTKAGRDTLIKLLGVQTYEQFTERVTEYE